MRALALFGLLGLLGCEPPKEEPNWLRETKCEDDSACAEGFICKESRCQKGARSAEELTAKRQEEAAAAAKAKADKEQVLPGQGRLKVRICPGFKNTPNAIGTLIATHQETKAVSRLDLGLVTPPDAWQSEYVFPSLPLGKYDVTANYGMTQRGVPDLVKLPCDKKAKPCRDKLIREMEVVAPEQEPKPKLNELKSCDFSAE